MTSRLVITETKDMKVTSLILHSITFIALVGALFFIWEYTQETSSTENSRTFNEIAASSNNDLQDDLTRMIPVSIGAILFSVILGIVLVEWFAEESWLYRIVDLINGVFAGIPSAFYGLICIYFFVIKFGKVSYLTQSFAILLLIVPTTVHSIQNAVRAVDVSIREAAYALGVNRGRVIVDHVIPQAFSNIMSAICAAVSRVSVVAALIFVVFTWIRLAIQSEVSPVIPQDIIILLITSVLFSVFSSLLKSQPDSLR